MPDDTPSILGLTFDAFVDAAERTGVPRTRAEVLYRRFHRLGVVDGAARWNAPCSASAPATADAPLPAWVRDERSAPQAVQVDDQTLKFTMRLPDGLETESVLIPMAQRAGGFTRTLCVSSQVGCAMGCRFCETAQMGLMRSLSAAEIVAQLHTARFAVDNPWAGPNARGFAVKNIVFMGMGEPMDNIEAVIQAIRVMTDKNAYAIPASNITVSTVGRTAGIRRLGELVAEHGYHRLNLAVSLNAPNDRIRSDIMPINRAEPIAQLLEALGAFPKRAHAAYCVEYVLIPGVNDAPEHCDEVCALLKPLRCSLNIIPYNPRRNSPWPAPTEESVQAFVARAIDHGQFCKRRGTKGRSAMAACGQLGNERIRQRRFAENPQGVEETVQIRVAQSPDAPHAA